MSYDARQIANWFINRAKRNGEALSVPALLKLIYISHGWSLALNDSPLYSNETEVWRFGPVIPDVYNAFKSQGSEVNNFVSNFGCEVSKEAEHLLEQVYNKYGKFYSKHLSNLTHVEDGPWYIAKQIGGWYAKIPNGLVKKHYDLKYAEATNGKI